MSCEIVLILEKKLSKTAKNWPFLTFFKGVVSVALLSTSTATDTTPLNKI